MAIFTTQGLGTIASFDRKAQVQSFRFSEKAAATVSVFLSHSHHDEILVGHVIQIFKKLGADVYVDWLDDGLPEKTNSETAAIIRAKIYGNDKFVVLGTPSGLASRWVPWELGIADQMKGTKKIAVLPIDGMDSAWAGSEYMGLYPRVEQGEAGPIVVGSALFARPLRLWLMS